MAVIQFYHLLTTPLDRALPKLLEKAYASGERTLLRVANEKGALAMNDWLWTYGEGSFLPHALANDPLVEQQPIVISFEDSNANNASILVITDGSAAPASNAYNKILDLFDGHSDEAVAAARARWGEYAKAGYGLSYIKQQEGGGWKVEKEQAAL